MASFDKSDISVYIHIPFCVRIRPGENTLLYPSNRESRNAYLDALERELMAAVDIFEGRQIASIHVGGGIATVVSPDRLARILLNFKRAYKVKPRSEFSVTAAPQTLVSPSLSSLNICNVNRISIAALTPVDKLLEQIGAPHRLDDIENGTAMVAKFGHSHVDVLLLYGIPGQTRTTIRNTVIAFTAVRGFTHFTLRKYELSEQSGVSREDCEAMYTWAVEALAERSVKQYSADSFAVEGSESPYRLHELNGMERAGFGLGARSTIDNMVCENTTDLQTYIANAGDFTKTIAAASELSPLDQMKRFIALRLQLVQGFSEAEFLDEFGSAPTEPVTAFVHSLEAAGLVSSVDGSIKPTPSGLMHADEVIRAVLGG